MTKSGPLSRQELVEITMRKQRGAQSRALRDMGIPHTIRHDGSPLVLWEWLSNMHGAAQAAPTNQPDFSRVK